MEGVLQNCRWKMSHGKIASACFVVFGLAICWIGNVSAQTDEQFLRSLLLSEQTKLGKQESLKHEFADRPADLISAFEDFDGKKDLTREVRGLLQDTLAELFEQDDYPMFVSKYSGTSSLPTKRILANSLLQSKALKSELKRAPKPVIKLLAYESDSMHAIRAFAKVFSLLQIKESIPTIRAKLKLSQLDFGTVFYLEISLIQLGGQETIDKYAVMLESPELAEKTHALNVFAQAGSPKVMKYLIPWLDRKGSPRLQGRGRPPFRYCDVPVHFANHFKNGELGPISTSGLASQQYTEKDIAEVKQWWESVKDTEQYE